MRAAYSRYDLRFIRPAVTSRAVMTTKETYFIKLWHEDRPDLYGIGECALFRGLGADDRHGYEDRIARLCHEINSGNESSDLSGWSSILFGYETALRDLSNGGNRCPFPSTWSRGESEIPINGLVWMGSADEMLERIDEKLGAGFRCVKLKIGGIDFDEELRLLQYIRRSFPSDRLELRLDANGAFSPANALDRLGRLSEFGIHSIEQPIRQGQWEAMAKVCRLSPIPVALDEELIGIAGDAERQRMLDTITPAYIILKPSLCGGLSASARWIELAKERGMGWWITSALESNIGLNAIAQWTSTLDTTMPQGLGTGMLYANNIPSPLLQVRDVLVTDPATAWEIPPMKWIE